MKLASRFVMIGLPLATLGLLLPSSCSAEFTWGYSAEISPRAFASDHFPNGVSVHGQFRVEETEPLSRCNTTNGTCFAVAEHTVVLNEQFFIGGVPDFRNEETLEIVVADDIPGPNSAYYRDRFASRATTNGRFQSVPTVEVMGFGLSFEIDASPPERPVVVTPGELPASAEALMEAFAQGNPSFFFAYYDTVADRYYSGSGRARIFSIPEPGSGVMGLVASSLVAARVRTKNRAVVVKT